MKKSFVSSFRIIAVCIVLASPSVPALPAVSEFLPGDDPSISLVPLRSPDDIQRQITSSREMRLLAEKRKKSFEDQRDRNKTLLELNEKDQKLIEKQIDKADDEKREPDIPPLKADLKRAELTEDIYNEQIKLFEAEIEAAEASMEFADATIKVCELEKDYVRQRGEFGTAQTEGADRAKVERLQVLVLEVEAKYLDGAVELSNVTVKLSERESSIASRKRSLFAVQRKLVALD